MIGVDILERLDDDIAVGGYVCVWLDSRGDDDGVMVSVLDCESVSESIRRSRFLDDIKRSLSTLSRDLTESTLPLPCENQRN